MTTPSTEAPRYLSLTAAAVYCSLSTKSIRRAISRGDLIAYRPVRGRVLLDRRDVDAWVTAAAGRKLRKGRGLSP